jgi:porin
MHQLRSYCLRTELEAARSCSGVDPRCHKPARANQYGQVRRKRSHRWRCFFLLLSICTCLSTQGFSETAQVSSTAGSNAPTTATPATGANPPMLRPPLLAPGIPTLPAVTDATNPAALDYVIQHPFFGDVPFRKELLDRGIDFTAHYISETASNTRGFRGTGTRYAQQIDFGLSFDLGKLGAWPDAVARFAMTDRAGRSLAADKTGSYFAYQEIFGQGQNLRFNEISLEKFVFEKKLALKLGFYPLGNDFATLPYVCNFTNVAFCGHPQSLPTNSGWADAPAGRWGGRVKWHMTDELTFQTGVFDVNPRVTRRQDGFKLDLAGSTGVIVPTELGYQLGKHPSDYAGTYKIGAYYDTSAAPDLAHPQLTDIGRYGLYLEAAQQIFKTGPDLRNGLALFGVYTISDENTAKFKDYFEAGASYRGLIPGRELDIVSLGWVKTDINRRFRFQLRTAGLPIQTDEQLVEFNYTIQLTPVLQLRPDVQYDIRPGAISTRPDTWVFGLQAKLTL